MENYYKILKLTQGKQINVQEENITIYLDSVSEKNWIVNDHQLLKNLHLDNFFYISGGGTYLIADRYLLVVKRSPTSIVNPNKLSLFTGRAEGLREWYEPWRIVRELFEEVILFAGNKILYPKHRRYQKIIDLAYQGHFKNPNLRSAGQSSIILREKYIKNSTLKIFYENKEIEHSSFINVNSRNEINTLFIFEIDVNLKSLRVIDVEEGNLGRQIYLFDLSTHNAGEVCGSFPISFYPVSRGDMSEHLCAVVNALI